jgi:copper chaperone CopZ
MQAEVIKIKGMTCGGCASTVTKALQKLRGVKHVAVSVPRGEAKVEFSEQDTSLEDLRSAVRDAGYSVDEDGARSAKSCCCG